MGWLACAGGSETSDRGAHTRTQAPHARASVDLSYILLFRSHLRRRSPAQPYGGRHLPLVACALASTPRRAVAVVPSDANGPIPPRAPLAHRCHPHRHNNHCRASSSSSYHRRLQHIAIASSARTACVKQRRSSSGDTCAFRVRVEMGHHLTHARSLARANAHSHITSSSSSLLPHPTSSSSSLLPHPQAYDRTLWLFLPCSTFK